jgi:hypothetical protein
VANRLSISPSDATCRPSGSRPSGTKGGITGHRNVWGWADCMILYARLVSCQWPASGFLARTSVVLPPP